MKISEIMKMIAASPIYRREIGTSFQLGLPEFIMNDGELFISFRPHIERFSKGIISCYEPKYELELVYPFRHTVHFRNLSYGKQRANRDNMPVCCIPVDNATERIRLLLLKADEVILCRENNTEDLATTVSEYRRLYAEAVESLGLHEIYGGVL